MEYNTKFNMVQMYHGAPLMYHNRPPSASSIPVTLLHPIFGTFIDETYTYVPTAEDNAFIRELFVAMSGLYGLETDRRQAFIQLLSEHYKIELIPGEIGATGYQTDGHCLAEQYMFVVTAAKNELGTGSIEEPYFQGYCYYREAFKSTNAADHFSSLPSFLIFYCGKSTILE